MGIDWPKLFSLQQMLDERIMSEHELEGTFFSERLLALQVEVGELANETRCFKYWSVKPPSEQDVILEEYVDGVHFILSLGLILNVDRQPLIKQRAHHETNRTLVEQFLQVNHCITNLAQVEDAHAYWSLFAEYLALGNMLGFSEDRIETAYLQKNKVNHQRQDEGY